MFKRLSLLLQSVIHSFWFLPVAMSTGAVALFGVTITLDRLLDLRGLELYGLPFAIHADGARSLMATITGSLITVASLVFSMTLVALTVAAGNIGARLLVRYMRHRTIQITLGLFLAGFIYALLTLSAVTDGPGEVPRLSVVTGMAFAIASFLWLAYAFHDLAKTIQVDQAVARLSQSLRTSIDSLGNSLGRSGSVDFSAAGERVQVMAARDGFVQSVNKEQLLNCANAQELKIKVLVKPGGLVLEGEPLMEVYGHGAPATVDENVMRGLRAAVIVGKIRSDLDDPFFCLRLINEIAVRALSPGVNDLYTAMICIDNMAEGIRRLLKVGMPGNVLFNEDGEAVVRLAPYELDDFLDGAFSELRRSVAPYPALVARLIDRIGRLARLTDDETIRDALLARVRMIADEIQAETYAACDWELIEAALETARNWDERDTSPVPQEN